MKFFDDFLCQKIKTDYIVCGDYCIWERTASGTTYVVCDGIGSGVYANISAITCANRIIELVRGGMSIRLTSEKVAASMHRARKEEMPYAAFTAVHILPDGQFTAYSYDAPMPVLLQNNHASVLTPHYYTVGFEVIGEISGSLNLGDSLIMFSDGVSQAGMGHGYGMGIGSDGVCDYINRVYEPGDDIAELPETIVAMSKTISGGNHEDDTTLAIIHCREANELALLTGPPSQKDLDYNFISDFVKMPGKKIICGSTTTDIAARELGLEVTMLPMNKMTPGQPPEYQIEGIDLVTEGAITLNRALNILDEPTEDFFDDSVVERLCIMLHEADVIHLMIGNALNHAHMDLVFKQSGVQVRDSAIRKMARKMESKGKLVIRRYY